MASAVFPVAANVPDLSGSYIPRLYAMKILIELYNTTVFGAIANTDYEGMVQNQGDTVRIRTLPDIDINSYTNGQNLVYQTPDPSYLDLLIDKGLYWAMSLNAVDLKQADIAYPQPWATHAAKLLSIELDRALLADIYGDVHASNAGTSAGAISGNIDLGTSADAFDFTPANSIQGLVNASQALDEQNVPVDGRWIVLPSVAWSALLMSDLKDASLAGDGTSIVRNGRVGTVANFTIYQSNQVPLVSDSGNAWHCLFGHSMSLTFAAQMTKTETLRNQFDFGDLMRSLMVYGYKVVKPEAMGWLYAYKG